MEFYDVIKTRRSIRGYKSDPIPAEVLERIGEAVSLSPSACNLQPWEFRVITNPEIRAKICKLYSGEWLAEAPAIVVALGNSDTCWKRLEGTPIIDIDMGIAVEHLVLAAAAEGLGTCWICAYNVPKMNEALNVEAPWSVYAITPLGYPNTEPRELNRKNVEDVFKVVS
jgi:nitroreductase